MFLNPFPYRWQALPKNARDHNRLAVREVSFSYGVSKADRYYRTLGRGALMRPKAYALLANEPNLSRVQGDVLNERKFLRVLSSSHDVFYNNQLIDWSKPDLGLEASSVEPPNQEYDIHYIRNNPAIAQRIEGKLLVMAYPYHPKVWERATGVVVTTWAWKTRLESLSQGSWSPDLKKWYPKTIGHLPAVLVAEQHIPKQFTDLGRQNKKRIIGRSEATVARAAFFGRLQKNSYPQDVIRAIANIRKSGTNVSFSYYGPKRGVRLPRWVDTFPPQPYEQVSRIQAGFDFLVYDQDETGNWLGSSKVLEAIGLGVPILVRRQTARIENLGHDYPLFYSSAQEAESNIRKILDDPGFHEEVAGLMRKRSTWYSLAKVEERFYGQDAWKHEILGN